MLPELFVITNTREKLGRGGAFNWDRGGSFCFSAEFSKVCPSSTFRQASVPPAALYVLKYGQQVRPKHTQAHRGRMYGRPLRGLACVGAKSRMQTKSERAGAERLLTGRFGLEI